MMKGNDLVELKQAPEGIPAVSAPGRLRGINGQPLPETNDESLQALQRSLILARDSHSSALIAQVNSLLGLMCFERFQLSEARQRLDEAHGLFRTFGSREQQAITLGHLAVVDYYQGNGDSALALIRRAVQIACDDRLIPLSGYLLCSQGAILCYMGHYRESSEAFGEARVIFAQADDALGAAWWQYIYGREYARAQGQFAMTVEQLESALRSLHGNVTPLAVIETLLALADCYVHLGNLQRAAHAIQQADNLIGEGRRHWYRPESYLVKVRLALADNDPKQAACYASSGLGAAGMSGDLRVLCRLYCVLATILEQDRDRIEDVYDALARAIAMGRVRSSRLDLAIALQQTGSHLKRFASRPTMRARGSGFLFEADRLFHSMGIPAPQVR